ncbi:MAG: aspartate kinase, partial [Clostridia bacterium]|nr:aspartate kinase [Clostridia bacterium]
PEGKVVTFSRGGSDISGAIVARAAGAGLYENWTDVSGFMACDPRIVPNPQQIRSMSYKELRELSYMGANVLHSESIFPVREADIPIRIKNTFRPEDEGTDILPTSKYTFSGRTVTGIAGKKNFTVIFIEKSLMNAEIGFAHKVLAVLMCHGISFEHMPSGIDTLSFVIDSEQLKNGVLDEVCQEIRTAVSPDNLRTYDDVALIAVVGHGMSRNVGTSARLFEAIARAGVNVRVIDQGSSELNIIVGVDNGDYERTLNAVYDEFFSEQA